MRQRVISLMQSRPGERLCASCVAEQLGVRHKNAHEAMLKLEAHLGFRRGYGRCSACDKTRMVSGVAPDRAPAPTANEVDGR